jgi:multicomponent K+:H+ antiporter subunit G
MIADLLISALLVMAGIFGLLGSYGLCRLPQLMQRLHSPTMATTIGIGAALIASMLQALVQGRPSWQELLITGFLLMSAPISAHFIARAHLHLNRRAETGPGKSWASDDSAGNH